MIDDDAIHMKEDHCLKCETAFDSATCLGSLAGSGPSEGDFTICLYCGYMMAFDKNMKVRELTEGESNEAHNDSRMVVGRLMQTLYSASKKHEKN